jgi:hypothetical protein
MWPLRLSSKNVKRAKNMSTKKRKRLTRAQFYADIAILYIILRQISYISVWHRRILHTFNTHLDMGKSCLIA